MWQRALSVGGGGGAEWILDATISGYNFEASWDYNAETIVMLFQSGSSLIVYMYDVATKTLLYASSATPWTNYGIDSRVTITPKSISGNFSIPLSNMSIIPIANKPNGYFA